MLVFWKEKLTFLAVPKTGSTAYQTALGPRADIVITDPPQLKHAPIYRYNRFFRPMFEKQGCPEMETLAVMREPISWLSSWYRYRARPFMNGKANSTADMSFSDFVRGYCAEKQPGFANVGSQAKFLEPRPNGTAIHHLFRHDDLGALNTFLAARLGEDIDVGRENESPSMEIALDPDAEALLRDRFAEDFALYASIPDGGLHDLPE